MMTIISTVGNVTRISELKTGPKADYVNFGLAVNEWKDGKRAPTFYECTVFGQDAENLVKAKAKKGSQLFVSGKFRTSVYERNGEKVTSLNITVLAWCYVQGSSASKGTGEGNGANGEAIPVPCQPTESYPPEGNFHDMTMNLVDDDLPF